MKNLLFSFFMLFTTLCLAQQTDSDLVVDTIIKEALTKTTPLSISTTSPILREQNFNKGNINDPIQLIQGRVAGLGIAKAGSDPNANFDLRLRGINSFTNANNAPLFLIDGVPVPDINYLDPNDIHSFTVQKDAAATARYGMSASGGLISIITKTGNWGKPKIEYNTRLSIDAVAKKPSNLSSNEYIGLGGTNLGASTNWFDEVTRKGLSHAHNLSFSGRNNVTTYRVALNYRNIQGLSLNDGFNQLNGSFNVSQDLFKSKVSVSATGFMNNRRSNLAFQEAFRYVVSHNPTAPILGTAKQGIDNGGYYEILSFDDFNPLAIIKQNKKQAQAQNIFLHTQAEWRIFNSLILRGGYARTQQTQEDGEYYSRLAQFRGKWADGISTHSTLEKVEDYANTRLYFNHQLGDFNVEATVGYDYRTRHTDFSKKYGNNITTDVFEKQNLFDAIKSMPDTFYTNKSYPYSRPNEADKAQRKLVAFYGNIGLDFQQKIFLNASLRREGSTMLGKNNQWGYFPAVSVGIDVSRILSLSDISLRLRGGFGITGGLPEREGLSQYKYAKPKQNKDSVIISQNANPNLKWEENHEQSYGLDFGFWQNRITGSVSYYNRQIKDLIYFFGTTPTGLFETNGIWMNGGSMTGKGFETSLSADIFKKSKNNFNWLTNINLATSNTILNEISNDYLWAVHEGSPLKTGRLGGPGFGDDYIALLQANTTIGQFWAYSFAGLNEKGEVQVKNSKGETILSNSASDVDRKIQGSGSPKAIWGWSNTITYKKFDMCFFLRGAWGHKITHTARAFYENNEKGSILNYNRIKTKYWLDNLREPRYTDYYIEKGDFIRLDNIEMGYTLKPKAIFTTIRVYIVANNLFTLTPYTGLDPEIRYTTIRSTDNSDYGFSIQSPFIMGVDNRNFYPTARSFSMGATVAF
jgi:TonB-dependent starch-binding outer membrane protein SusC